MTPHPDRFAIRPPPSGGGEESEAPSLTEVVETLSTLGKAQLPAQLARWLDGLDETGRWALLKLVTGGLRIGVSARLAKTAAASLGGKEPNEIEILWPGLAPPYTELFAWLEGRADKPVSRDPAPFRPAMLAHAIEDTDLRRARSRANSWRSGSGTASASRRSPARRDGRRVTRLYSRTGEDISKSFPDLAEALRLPGAIDGELLIVRDGRVQSFNVLQQRLNRKAVTPKLLTEFPAHLRAYDLLVDGDEDLRELPFAERRARLEALRRTAERSAHRHFAAGAIRDLGDAHRGARRSRRGRRRRRCGRGRGRHAQAPRRGLCAGPAERACGGNGSAIR